MSRTNPCVANCKIAGTSCSFETGRIARQASGAVIARSGDAVILATVVGAETPRADAGFFPLTVEYREKLAAAGRIPGTYNRREGRIADHEILNCRLIDRTVRSLFPDGYRAEVQIQVTVLSADPTIDTTTLALLGACAALHISPVPCRGPAAGVRIVRAGGAFRAFPTEEQRAEADIDFVVSAGPDGLVMVEGEAREVNEEDAITAMEQALTWIERLRKAFAELSQSVGNVKWPVREAPALPAIPQDTTDQLREALAGATEKSDRREAVRVIRDEYLASIPDDADANLADHASAFDAQKQSLVRKQILEGHRPDGRGPKDIRAIWSEVGWLPRAHGSSIFTRGETQALVTCTLGAPEDAMRIEGLGGRQEQRFILHYNFPPYSVGETRPLRGPGLREIGHGALAHRGLRTLLPTNEDFPYTIRIESEISESNGSSSMATVCGGSLALFHAGVPVSRAAAGIAMGMVADGDRSVVLSDIVGEEDHLGDMDFKVVGTNRGITALQLDNKIGGLSFAALIEALVQARSGREHILSKMAKTIAVPAAEMPPRAPRVTKIAILPDTVGLLVGPRGATIKDIQAQTGARVSVDDHGTVLIYAAEGPAANRARQMVQQLVGVLEVDHYYHGAVTGVKDFGVFVKINEANEGLVPKDQISDPPPVEGAAVVVKVLGTDERGRLRLSIREGVDVDAARIDY